MMIAKTEETRAEKSDDPLEQGGSVTPIGAMAQMTPAVTANGLAATFAGRLTPETKKAYLYSLNSFGKWLGTGDDLAATAARLCAMSAGQGNLALMQYAEAEFKGLSPSTKNSRLQGVRSLLRLARILGLANWEPEMRREKVEKLKDTRGPGREKVIQLIDTEAAKITATAARNLALLRLNYDLALRRESILRIDVEHWERKTRSIWVTTKGRVEARLKGLPEQTSAAIEKWMEFRGDRPGAMFVRIRRGDKIERSARLSSDGYYRVLRELAGVLHEEGDRPVRPHGIRHSAITNACRIARNAGLGLEAVMAFSDHASVATLSHYLDAEEGLQKRVAQMLAAETGP